MLSQNGYVVFETTRTTGPLPRLRKWIIPGTDRHLITRDGSAGFVLAHMALWWHQKIERLDVGVWDEWGQAFRPVRGQSTGFSNHASGTAVDLNATQHPRGVALAKTFRAIQVARIRARLLTYRGVIRWGGDYTHSPVDGMHLEIVKGMTATERLARRLSASPRGRQILAANPGAAEVIWDGQVPPAVTKPAPTPKPLPPVAPRKPVQAERLAVDYSYSRPDPAAIKAAGYRGVVRYVSSKAAKNLTTTEATALRKAGLWIALVFEESAKRAGAGAKAGRLDAGFAEHQADLLGYPKDAVIFYAVDYDAAASEVRPYFDGLRAAAKRPVGVYGSNKVVMGVLADYYWQTVAWSDGLVSNKANWLQRTSHSHQVKGSKLTDWDENLLIGGKVPVWNAHEKPTPPPIVVPPPNAVDFSFGTANIQNLPNLSAAQVLEDVATAAAQCDVVVWQEIAEAADQAALDTVLAPADWWHLFPELEVPISVRRSKFEVQSTGKIVLSAGRAHVSPTRYLAWAICSSVEFPDLPPVVFAGSHYVSGAFTHPGQLGDADGWRLTAWAEDFDGTAAKVREWVAAGFTVVFGADTNAPTPHMDKFTPDQTWVVDDSTFDKIAVCPAPGGVTVTPLSVERLPLNSDHDLRVMNARIAPPTEGEQHG